MIKITFVDWWGNFDFKKNFITDILTDSGIEYTVIEPLKEVDSVDFVFCSCFGKDYANYKCVRIYYTGENYIPDFNLYDYGMGFEIMTVGDRYLRFPLYGLYNYDETEWNKDISEECFRRKFCSYMVSNGSATDGYRDALFDKLSLYKKVDSGGRWRNNIGCPSGVDDKNKFLSDHKFSITGENMSHIGYCTEKIVDAFEAKTIPIYWGDPLIESYFNPKSFINCYTFDSMEAVVERIKEIDTDKDLYMEMINQPKLIDNSYSITSLYAEMSKFIIHIVKQKKEDAYRRSLYGWSLMKENEAIEMNKKGSNLMYHLTHRLFRK